MANKVQREQAARSGIGGFVNGTTNANEHTDIEKEAVINALSTEDYDCRVVSYAGNYGIVKWYDATTGMALTSYKSKSFTIAKALTFLETFLDIYVDNEPAPTSVTLNDIAETIIIGGTLDLNQTVLPATADQDVLWVSSNVAVATVSSTGLVTGVGPGVCNITASTQSGPVRTVTCVITILNTNTDFETFTLAAQTGAATINTGAHTIAIEVANGTVVTALIADFTLSDGASSMVGAVAQVPATTPNNFTNPVVYAVTAENGIATQNWTVTVTVAA